MRISFTNNDSECKRIKYNCSVSIRSTLSGATSYHVKLWLDEYCGVALACLQQCHNNCLQLYMRIDENDITTIIIEII